MNKESDAILNRLFDAARPRTKDSMSQMPFGFADRVVRRAFAEKEQVFTAFFPTMRIAIGVAIVALCISILVNLPRLKQTTVGVTEFAIQHQLTSQVLNFR